MELRMASVALQCALEASHVTFDPCLGRFTDRR
jgi:hypothetical protein